MSSPNIQGDDSPSAFDRSQTVEELELRLREQVTDNARLDTELRYLLQDLAVRKEFIARLEGELESMHAVAGRQIELVAEFSAYRARISHRIVDGFVMRIHRLPWVYRPLKWLSRAANAIATGSSMHHSTAPNAVDRIIGDDDSVVIPTRFSRQPK